MSRMSTDDVKLRLSWAMEEITRVNTEKEVALATNVEWAKEFAKLKKGIDGAEVVKSENKKLRKSVKVQDKKVKELQGQLEEARKCLDSAKFALRGMPGPIQKLCGKVLVPQQEVREVENSEKKQSEIFGEAEQAESKEKEKKETKRRRLSRSFF